MKPTTTDASELLARLKAAVAVANDAERRATTARDEHVSRSKAVGVLLLDRASFGRPVSGAAGVLRIGR